MVILFICTRVATEGLNFTVTGGFLTFMQCNDGILGLIDEE